MGRINSKFSASHPTVRRLRAQAGLSSSSELPKPTIVSKSEPLPIANPLSPPPPPPDPVLFHPLPALETFKKNAEDRDELTKIATLGEKDLSKGPNALARDLCCSRILALKREALKQELRGGMPNWVAEADACIMEERYKDEVERKKRADKAWMAWIKAREAEKKGQDAAAAAAAALAGKPKAFSMGGEKLKLDEGYRKVKVLESEQMSSIGR